MSNMANRLKLDRPNVDHATLKNFVTNGLLKQKSSQLRSLSVQERLCFNAAIDHYVKKHLLVTTLWRSLNSIKSSQVRSAVILRFGLAGEPPKRYVLIAEQLCIEPNDAKKFVKKGIKQVSRSLLRALGEIQSELGRNCPGC